MNFENIAGYEEIKKELLLIKSWWDNKEELQKKGIILPKSILFQGPMGTGKSLFAREFAALFPDAEIIKIDGTHDLEHDEITEKFNYARGLDHMAIIMIDEVDLVAMDDERALLTELDGLGGNNDNIFVLATTNEFCNMNPAITRRGRLDYIIGIGNPSKEERKHLFEYYFDRCGIKGDYDFEYLAIITKGENAVNIQAIVNEARLRYGESPTMDQFEDTADKISRRDMDYYGDAEVHDDYLTCLHEIGHVITAYQYPEYFRFYKATVQQNSLAGGSCKVFPTSDDPGNLERMKADMDISLGGYLACDMLYKYKDRGAEEDLDRARHISAALVNTFGYAGIEPLLCHSPHSIPTSPFKKYKNEKMSEKLLRESMKRVRKIIKENKKDILILAKMLKEKKKLSKEDVDKVLL